MPRPESLFFFTAALALVTLASASVQAQTCERPEMMADPGSAVDGWWRLEDCFAELELGEHDAATPPWRLAHLCGRLARAIARLGDDADRERLWSLYDEVPDRSGLRRQVLEALLDWNIARAVAKLSDAPPPRDISRLMAPDSELPEQLAEASSELQRAWRLYQGVTTLGQEALWSVPREEQLSFHEHADSFFQTVTDLARGSIPAFEAGRQLGRYWWGSWCGTGSEVFSGPRSRALLIAYLRLGHLDKAASTATAPWTDMEDIDEFLVGWRRRLLEATGIDWETFFVGGVLAGQQGFASPLGRHGSERAALMLLDALDLPHPYREGERVGGSSDVIAALGAFVSPAGPCEGYSVQSSEDVDRDLDAPVILPDLEERVLAALARLTGPGAGRAEAEAASHVLLRLCRPESHDTFERMRRSPFYLVRSRGTTAMRSFGDTVPDARPAPPVRYRLIVDGSPLASESVSTLFHLEGGVMRHEAAQTTSDGWIRLERDGFLDARTPITRIVLSARDPANPAQACFRVTTQPPRDLDEPTTIEVRTGVLELVIPKWAFTDGETSVDLFMSRVGESRDPFSMSWNLTVTESPVRFRRLQRGTYDARVYLPDGTRLESPAVTLGDRPVSVELTEGFPDDPLLPSMEP
jgi:hypothetical protein